MISSGFDLARPRQNRVIPRPEGVTLSDGPNNGELNASVEAVPGKLTYLYEYTMDPITPDSVWITQSCSESNLVLKGLESGKRYWVRVGAVGSKDQVMYSDPVSRIVQ